MNLEYATVCSGIEAPSVAWSGMGWNALTGRGIRRLGIQLQRRFSSGSGSASTFGKT